MNNLFLNKDNSKIGAKDTVETSGSGSSVIPANESFNVYIDQVSWDEYEGEKLINIRWCVTEGKYAKRKIFQKLRVYDKDFKRADRAKEMLACIDTNCGGKLMSLESLPTNADFNSALLNREMNITVDVWEANGKTGNWVKSIKPKVKSTHEFVRDVVKEQNAQAQTQPQAKVDESFDDDIPF